jgi:2-octaprenylphenol hydroxylase
MDIIIVGAGMVGLALAKALEQQRFSVTVIDAKLPELTWDESQPALRVSAISAASQRLLESLGVWSVIAASKACHAYQKMEVWDENSSAQIDFSASSIGASQLGYMVDNRFIIKALWQSLCSSTQVKILAPEKITHYEFDGEKWQVQLASGKKVSAKLLVGADGAHSAVRQHLGISLTQTFSGHSALVCTVKTEKSHRDTAYQRFLTTGPLAFLPLSDPHQCSIVWSNNAEQANHLAAVEAELFDAYVTEAIEQRLGKVVVLGERVVFPLNRQHAEQYAKSQAVLIGDAAHTIHPLAGQGVNVGFADVAALSQALQDAQQRDRPFYTPAVLQRYQYDRYAANTAILLAMEGFGCLFSNQQPVKVKLRTFGVNLVNRLDMLKSWCMENAMGVV